MRSSGILLHPTSLPGACGVGDLGRESVVFLDWMVAAGQEVWQVLPLGPLGYGSSPYSSTSAFAGNPLLISPHLLTEEGLLPAEAVEEVPDLPPETVDYERVIPWRESLLRRSWQQFRSLARNEIDRELDAFLEAPEQQYWLADWTLFAALRGRLGEGWSSWPRELRLREPDAIRRARRELASEISYHAYIQFLFFRQWRALRREAHSRGIRLLGDLPYYVAEDSADVWAHRELFSLDAQGRPTAVAGVPPDYFSATGQRWGNPTYRWQAMEESGFDWWIERVRANLRLADFVRVDHFRGFAAYWEVPAHERTAVNGRWIPAPGASLLEALRSSLGKLPLVAEDLGHITAEVHDLRMAFALPGMKVLQFGFSELNSEHLPHRYSPDCVVYTGTHDNDTACGWHAGLTPQERSRVLDYLGSDGSDIAWDLIRAALTSVAELAVVPLQDVLRLDSRARMNTPSRPDGNWRWRAAPGALDSQLARQLRRLVELSGRLNAAKIELEH